MKKFSFCLILISLPVFLGVMAVFAFANGVVISNVSLEDRASGDTEAAVEFDIEWDNAYKAGNWHDAVWIFLKANKNSGTTWYHAKVKSYTGIITTADDSSGYSVGTSDAIMIAPSGDEIGVFIYPAWDGAHGKMNSKDVRVVIDYGEAPLSASRSDTIQVRVFAIEMIRIPTANYYVGDAGASNALRVGWSSGPFQLKSSLVSDIKCPSTAYGDDAALAGTGVGVAGDGGLDTDDNGTIDNANYPVAYNSYILMKYELTQGQYRDFLNTLTRAQQNTRTATSLGSGTTSTSNRYVMTNSSGMSYRQGIRCPATFHTSNPITFGCDYDGDGTFDESTDGEWIAMNYLSWPDAAAYADWSGLRPATELEYQKACSGTGNAGNNGYAAIWTNAPSQTDSLTSAGTNEERGGSSWYNFYEIHYSEDGTTSISGPLRVGFAAGPGTGDTQRSGTGSGFYGHKELSGNVTEWYVSLGTTANRAFQGTHGDGVLTTTASYEGNATNTDWPGINATSARGVTDAGPGRRGGSWDTTADAYSDMAALAMSDRTEASSGSTARSPYWGGRFASSLPGER